MVDIRFDPDLDPSSKVRLRRFAMTMINARYLFIAMVLHVLLLLVFGKRIVFQTVQNQGVFDSSVLMIGPRGGESPAPPLTSSPIGIGGQTVGASLGLKINPITTIEKLNPNFSIPPVDVPVIISDPVKISANASKGPVGNSQAMREARDFLAKGVTGGNNAKGVTGTGRSTEAKFTSYILKYEGGDWNCNFGETDGDTWYQNCFFNLMQYLERCTQGKIKAKLGTKELILSEREWIENVNPPFVFMTGHKDFYFSPKEIENLRIYLNNGGVLWIDSALPGRRSRFDMAVRREMKKVAPDKEFEIISNHHPVYESYFKFHGPPKGMNGYDEPVEVMNFLVGKVGVFYTLNAYSDLWETGLTFTGDLDLRHIRSEKLKRNFENYGPHIFIPGEQYPGFATGKGWEKNPPYRPFPFYEFFGNVNKDSIINSYKFGVNIAVHLLTRFQDEFNNLPSS